ncbi:MAG: nitrogenase component 1 [Lachnospiraceae bacterium]|nr:nitrogenase component 1 [Lachnospiraceae bacterium]
MLKMIHGAAEAPYHLIAEAAFPVPFPSRLEYNSPAHGTWNIVHIGMLLPGSHQIYICTGNCNRGVVLTAAEMNASDRFSTITVKENNILEGDMEDLIIDGVTEILEKLPKKPPAVILFPSCVHRFMGCDIPMVYRILRSRYPEILFVEGYMDCILQKAGVTPDQRLRRELYSGLTKRLLNRKSVNIIGNTLRIDKEENELTELLRSAGCDLKQIADCKTFEEYLSMSESYLNLTLLPIGKMPAEVLEERLGMKHLYLPQCFGYEEIIGYLEILAEELGVPAIPYQERIQTCEEALKQAKTVIGNTPIAIDYTAIPRPLGLARLLLEHGFQVFRVYADSFIPEEEADFKWLQQHVPELEIYSTIHAAMRVMPREYEGKGTVDCKSADCGNKDGKNADCGKNKVLAIGQKAAYFTGTGYFVNMVEGGGLYGFSGICKMAELMTEAFLQEKDTEDLIKRKGLGCESCI